MAKEKEAFHLVNPKGVIHVVEKAHAVWRLNQGPQWRLATAEEKEAYETARAEALEAKAEAREADRKDPNPAARSYVGFVQSVNKPGELYAESYVRDPIRPWSVQLHGNDLNLERLELADD